MLVRWERAEVELIACLHSEYRGAFVVGRHWAFDTIEANVLIFRKLEMDELALQ